MCITDAIPTAQYSVPCQLHLPSPRGGVIQNETAHAESEFLLLHKVSMFLLHRGPLMQNRLSWCFVLMVCMYLPSFIHLLADSYPAYSLVRCWSFIGPSMTPLIMWHYAKLMHCWCLARGSRWMGPISQTVSSPHNSNFEKITGAFFLF